MSKRPAASAAKSTTSSTASSSSRGAKAPKPSFSMESLLGEITKMESPEDISKGATKLHTNLVTEWKKKDRDMQRIGIYLEGAKVLLTKLEFLPVSRNPSVKDLILARDILELGAWYSVLKCAKNTCHPDGIKDFERYISKLKQYYFDLGKLINKKSDHMCEILGMNLLNLLSQNKIADFHLELELLIHKDSDLVLENPYIKKAMEIEQYIMEGQYNKIYALKGANQEDLKQAGLTSSGYKYFINHLETTLKEHTTEIAGVIGSAYERLSMDSAMKLLNLTDSIKLAEIIKAQKWSVKEGYIYFHPKKDIYDSIPAEEMVQNVLKYADELETIV